MYLNKIWFWIISESSVKSRTYIFQQYTVIYIYNCEPNKRNNTWQREIRRVGKGNTLFCRPYIDENNFWKMYISVTKVSYNKIQIVIDAHVYKQWLLIKIKQLREIINWFRNMYHWELDKGLKGIWNSRFCRFRKL